MSDCKEKTNVVIKEILGEIHFSGGINQESMALLVDKLLELEGKLIKKCRSLKRKFKEDYNEEEDNTISFKVEPHPIKLFITSGGGSVYHVLSAIDTIKGMKVPVNTYVKGIAASAATLLSLAGKRKFITENSYMLIHEIRSGMWGKYSELKDDFYNMTVLNDHIKNYYVKNTKLTKEEVDEQLKQDVIWNPEKCLEKGLVDDIIKSN
jgi:ATP-dependent protease ClpP protease subunit